MRISVNWLNVWLGKPAQARDLAEAFEPLPHALDNDQPKLVIDPAFWPEFMRNGFHQCVHRAACGALRCLGLNTAYVHKYGWEADLLVPLPPTEPAR